jgi:endonuclease/exonuclease/phosphatase family metal-dependent hydrolase
LKIRQTNHINILMNIAFWNLNKKELSDQLVEFTNEKSIDILCLAEVTDKVATDFIRKINIFNSKNKYAFVACNKNKVRILTKLSPSEFVDKSHLYKSERLSAHLLKLPSVIELNLICVHFHAKNYWSEDAQALECSTLSKAINDVEASSGCYNTIVIGDFNMNPFEKGMISAIGLHAIPDLDLAFSGKKGRAIDNTNYPYFYNPMWNFFGDHRNPVGTYFYHSPDNLSYEWHLFDQILLRPNLKNNLPIDYVEIVTTIGGDSLVNAKKRPDKDKYSDHLPIILRLKI